MTTHPLLARRTDDGRIWDDILKWITHGYTIDAGNLLRGPISPAGKARVVYRPIPEAATQPYIIPRNAILHTNAGAKGASSLYGYITQASVTGEPHLQVGWDQVEQYMPFNRRADCNYSANSWLFGGKRFGAISFETQDHGSAVLDKTPWSLQQVEMMVGTLTALCVVYSMACTAPSTWDSSGIGHHTLHPFQGIAYKAWSNVRGKTCPGKARIAQMDEIRRQVAENLAAFSTVTGWKCAGA